MDSNKIESSTQQLLNSADLNLYFDFITHGKGHQEIYSGFWLGSSGKEPIKGLGVWFGNIEDIEIKHYELVTLGEEFPTFHVTLNITSLSGRKTKHVQAVRIWCCDIDTKITPEECRKLVDKYSPGLVVESSPGKYHLYWQADKRVKLEEWLSIQAGITAELGGDLNLAELSHTIRVPGMARRTKDGLVWVPRVVYSQGYTGDNETQVWAPEHWQELVPGVIEKGVKALEARKAKRAKNRLGATKPGIYGAEHRASEIKAGERNQYLFDVVFGYARDGNEDITEESCIELAERVNSAFSEPLDESEVEKTSRSAFERGMSARQSKTAKILQAQKLLIGPIDLEFKYDYSAPELKKNRFTDMAIVQRVHQRFADCIVRIGKILYAFDLQNRTWTSQIRDNSVLHEYVKVCASDTQQDSNFVADLCTDARGGLVPDKIKQWQRHFSSSSIQKSIVSALEKDRHYPRMLVTNFDSNPYVFYCSNGALNMLSGELKEVNSKDYLLHQSSAVWDAKAECPWWLNFLEELFSGQKHMVSFVQEVFGYSLSGSIEEQKVFVHYGSGCNGKSKVLFALRLLLGEYSALMGANALAHKKAAVEQEFQRIGVKTEGKRCMIIDDMDTKTQWNEGVIKGFTGPLIPVRRLYEEERDIPNRAKFHFGCNEAPEPESENFGILRRICIIPYNRVFTQDALKEREIVNEIEKEKSGILRWAVEGCKRVHTQGGINYPSEVLLSTEEYREEHFNIEQAIQEMFAATKNSQEIYLLSQLVDDVNMRLIEAGFREKKVSPDSLGRYLKSRCNAVVERKWVEGSKKRYCNIHLLYTPKHRLNSI